MAISPKGPISVPKHLLRDMVAGLPSFAEALRDANVIDSPQSRVYLNAALLLTEDAERPFATISLPEDSNTFSFVAGGAQNIFKPAGKLWLGLSMDALSDSPYGDDSSTQFDNFVGMVWQELCEQAAVDTALPISGPTWALPPRITKPGEGFSKSFWIAIIEVPWE